MNISRKLQSHLVQDVAKIGELELDEDERPVYPPKIRQIKIVDNPFHDIIPRITAAEKRAQQLAKEQMQREREEASKRKKGKKDSKLLSFGDDGEEDDVPQIKKKPMFREDLVASESSGQKAERQPVQVPTPKAKDIGTIPRDTMDITPAPAKPEESQKPKKPKQTGVKTESDKREAEFSKIEEEIRKLTRRRDSDSEDDKPTKKSKKNSSIMEQNAKYQRGTAAARRAAKKKDESGALSALERFRSKLQQVQIDDNSNALPDGEERGAKDDGDDEDGVMDVDDDVGWLSHRLHFAKDDLQETARAEHDYEVIDPRMRGAKAKEEEMERKRSKKDGAHGHGYKPRPQGHRR
ncbi:Peptidyl-prolyl isomerase cwc27 [Serendipita sp. 399]|nr:Peptidyl-prolyl isomerase cwc27 [Serendipita sp. 399]